jgi:hypothetical protein
MPEQGPADRAGAGADGGDGAGVDDTAAGSEAAGASAPSAAIALSSRRRSPTSQGLRP